MRALVSNMLHIMLEQHTSIVEKYWLFLRQPRDRKLHHSFCHKYDVPECWFILDHPVGKKHNFDFQHHCTSWVINVSWYNTTICS